MVQTRTRSGRVIKKPEIFQPTETLLEDDYGEDEHDTDFDYDIDTEDELYSDDDEYSDEDENGNLEGFVVDDEEDEDEDEEE